MDGESLHLGTSGETFGTASSQLLNFLMVSSLSGCWLLPLQWSFFLPIADLHISDSATTSLISSWLSNLFPLHSSGFCLHLSLPSVLHSCFNLISLSLHNTTSLFFLATPTLANPICRLLEAFLGIVNRCPQCSADRIWSIVLQLWKRPGQ